MSKKTAVAPRPKIDKTKPERLRASFERPPERFPSVTFDTPPDAPETIKTSAKLISDERVVLDKDKAIEYLELTIFAGERQVNDKHVQYLLDEMVGVRFNWDLVTLCRCIFKGVEYKINGQHTCWAFAYLADKKPSAKYTVRELVYEAKSEEQLKQLYASFDRGMVRTESHVTKVFLIGTDVAEGLPRELLGKAASGVSFWLFEKTTDRKRIGPQEITTLIQQQYADLFRRVVTFYKEYQTEHFLRRQPVLAALFEIFAKSPAKAEEFWTPVVTGVGINDQEDPRLALRNHLMSTSLQKTTSFASKKVEDAETQYRTCVHLWNHWRTGKSVKVVRVPRDEKRPKAR
jgi:hypothetical protein